MILYIVSRDGNDTFEKSCNIFLYIFLYACWRISKNQSNPVKLKFRPLPVLSEIRSHKRNKLFPRLISQGEILLRSLLRSSRYIRFDPRR